MSPRWLSLPDLPNLVRELIAQIPPGHVSTYGTLAKALGDERARSARWLGEFLHQHEHTPDCPCHRVVRANGEIGLHVSGDPLVKVQLLEWEGVAVSEQGRVDVSDPFHNFRGEQPLARLRQFQLELAGEVQESPLAQRPKFVAAVDVAYRSDDVACAAYVLMDLETLTVQEQFTLERPCQFPYIPGYLTFRELPIMLELCEQARAAGCLGDVVFCDGNGRLHPWRAGIATALGVLLDHPVIGVGKSLLCGRVLSEKSLPAGRQLVIEGDEPIGIALAPNTGKKSVYVSVGHRISLAEAADLAEQTIRSRQPEPIIRADRLTKLLKRSAKPA